MESVYRINKAGVYIIGHFGACEIRLDLGRPSTCRTIRVTTGQAVELMRILGGDYEDGAYMNDVLRGQDVLVVDNEHGYAISIGDPYGNESVILKEVNHD